MLLRPFADYKDHVLTIAREHHVTAVAKLWSFAVDVVFVRSPASKEIKVAWQDRTIDRTFDLI